MACQHHRMCHVWGQPGHCCLVGTPRGIYWKLLLKIILEMSSRRCCPLIVLLTSCHCMQLLRDVRAFQGTILREEGQPDTVVLASKLAAVGYKLSIRTALGGGSGRSCFHNLHHEFLLVSGDPEFGSPQDKEYIVDPYFRCMLSPHLKHLAVHLHSWCHAPCYHEASRLWRLLLESPGAYQELALYMPAQLARLLTASSELFQGPIPHPPANAGI